MMAAKTFLPGCYRNLLPFPDESFAGFILRLAAANGYSGISEVLRALQSLNGTRCSDAFMLRASCEGLEQLSLMATGTADALSGYACEVLAGGASMVSGVRVPDDARMDVYAQVCTSCLFEHGRADAAWDLAPVVTCPEHGVYLRDRCGECGERLRWSRSSLFHCGRCGADLRRQAIESAPEGVRLVSEDFSALAPFRLRSRNGRHRVVAWDTVFMLAQLLARPHADWCHETPRRARLYRELRIEERRRVAEVFAASREGSAYLPWRAGAWLLGNLRHLDVPPILEGARPFARRFATAHGLTPEIVDELLSLEPSTGPVSGAELHDGRPPVLTTLDEVLHYVGRDESALELAKHFRVLPTKNEDDLGFDIDHVLALKRFLDEELLHLTAIAPLVGEAVTDQDLPLAIQALRSDLVFAGHITRDALMFFQQALMTACIGLQEPDDPVSFSDLFEAHPDAGALVVSLAARLVGGGFSRCRWAAPYTWDRLEFERSELIRFLEEHPLVSRPVDAAGNGTAFLST